MAYFVLKAAISGALIALISEVARRSPAIGGLIASLPLLSIVAVIWLWRDTSDVERIAAHLQATFWYVLPTLPMFIAMPALLRSGVGFWTSLAAACLLTIILYGVAMWLLPKFGVTLK